MKPILLLTAMLLMPLAELHAESKPNILIILADDLGYGDVQCYNSKRGKILTPHIDRLASQGMRFTDGHSSSAVCSPSRYTLLTGRYHWRTRLQTGIVGVFGEPLIAADRLTIGGLAKQHGYRTAAIGKWHLGMEWAVSPNDRKFLHIPRKASQNDESAPKKGPEANAEHLAVWRGVFTKQIAGGPTARGFDTYFGTDVPNWPPYCFIENDRTLGIPSEFLPAENFKNNLASTQGPALPGWKLESVLPTIADHAADFIADATKKPAPFLLYLALTSPHTPIVVSPEWQGKSGLSPYADFVMQTDAAVGRVLDALETSGAAERTLVFFTSDNGCAPYAGVAELEKKGHYPSGPLRGYKFDVFEGGHRVPFIVRWPGVVKPNSECARLVHQADLIATLSEILGAKLPENSAEDSISFLPLLKGEEHAGRETAVSCSSNGVPCMRQGPWKLIFASDSGGRTKADDKSQPVQLYNLAVDLSETKNLAAEQPELISKLRALMEKLISDGRSTPGAPQKNDVKVRRYSQEPVPRKSSN